MLAVSLSWALAVDLTPPEQRPWVGGSPTNSVLELALGYNGLSRVTGNNQGPGAGRGAPGGFQGRGGFGPLGGAPGTPGFAGPRGGGLGGFGSQGLFGAGFAGPLRLFTGGVLAEQWAWLVPLAAMGLLPAGLALRRRFLRDRRGQAILLWAGWLAIYGIVFSAAEGTFHPYYLIMLAPAAGARAGIGLAGLWRAYRAGGWMAWLLPLALLITAIWQLRILAAYPSWAGWLTPLALGGSVLAAVLLALGRLLDTAAWRRAAPALVGVGMGAVLAAPLAWSVTPLLAAPHNASLPLAGPSEVADTSST